MLKIKQFTFNIFGVSTFLITDTDTADTIVVDPGMLSDDERQTFDEYVADNGLEIKQIINTHLHLDHCFGTNYVRNRYGAPTAAHSADAFLAKSIATQARRFGIILIPDENVEIDVELHDGDIISLGKHTIEVRHVPGHSPGSIALYCAEYNFVISGDTLFNGAIGRTDLQGGDHLLLIKSIKNKLLTLPDNTTVLPGHDKPTTIGDEKVHNPYLR